MLSKSRPQLTTRVKGRWLQNFCFFVGGALVAASLVFETVWRLAWRLLLASETPFTPENFSSDKSRGSPEKVLQPATLRESHENMQVIARVGHAVDFYPVGLAHFLQGILDHALVFEERELSLSDFRAQHDVQGLF